MWINPIDARKRGIANGDRIRIFNDRGEVHIEAKVTPRMMPGVVALGEGAWYNPDASRVDQAGSINVLTTSVRRRWRRETRRIPTSFRLRSCKE